MAGSTDALVCTVEHVLEDRIVLAPSVAAVVDLVRASRVAATVEWATRRGQARVAGTLGAVAEPGREALLFEVDGGEVVQRREHVRSRAALPVTLAGGGHGTTTDFSGGGLRVQVDRELTVGATVQLALELPDGTIEAPARVASRYEDGSYGLELGDFDVGERERLIRAVFAQLRLETRLR